MSRCDYSLPACRPAGFQPAHLSYTALLRAQNPPAWTSSSQASLFSLVYFIIPKPDQQATHVEALATSWWKKGQQASCLVPALSYGWGWSTGLGALGSRHERGSWCLWNRALCILLPWDCLFYTKYTSCSELLPSRAYRRLLTSTQSVLSLCSSFFISLICFALLISTPAPHHCVSAGTVEPSLSLF